MRKCFSKKWLLFLKSSKIVKTRLKTFSGHEQRKFLYSLQPCHDKKLWLVTVQKPLQNKYVSKYALDPSWTTWASEAWKILDRSFPFVGGSSGSLGRFIWLTRYRALAKSNLAQQPALGQERPKRVSCSS